MTKNLSLAVITVVVALAFAWGNRDSEVVRNLLYSINLAPEDASAETATEEPAFDPQTLFFDEPKAGVPEAKVAVAQSSIAIPTGGVRKCQVGQKIIYTDEACPTGGNEKAMRKGGVTVMEFQKKDSASTSKPDGPVDGNLLEQSEGQSLRAKRMEQIINQSR